MILDNPTNIAQAMGCREERTAIGSFDLKLPHIKLEWNLNLFLLGLLTLDILFGYVRSWKWKLHYVEESMVEEE